MEPPDAGAQDATAEGSSQPVVAEPCAALPQPLVSRLGIGNRKPLAWWAASGGHTSPRDPPHRRYTFSAREVYDTCMSKVRTNIEIEDDYVRTIMDRYGVHTKTEAVELALRHLAGPPVTREQALAMRGGRAIDEVPGDASPRGAA